MHRRPLKVNKTKHKCHKTGKVKWRTELDARMALANIDYKMRASTKNKEQRPYRCPFCEYWHLTHQPLRERKEKTHDRSEGQLSATG